MTEDKVLDLGVGSQIEVLEKFSKPNADIVLARVLCLLRYCMFNCSLLLPYKINYLI